jgi:hypothetical protein
MDPNSDIPTFDSGSRIAALLKDAFPKEKSQEHLSQPHPAVSARPAPLSKPIFEIVLTTVGLYLMIALNGIQFCISSLFNLVKSSLDSALDLLSKMCSKISFYCLFDIIQGLILIVCCPILLYGLYMNDYKHHNNLDMSNQLNKFVLCLAYSISMIVGYKKIFSRFYSKN